MSAAQDDATSEAAASDPASSADPGEARARRLCTLAIAWGFAAIALLWLFKRAFNV